MQELKMHFLLIAGRSDKIHQPLHFTIGADASGPFYSYPYVLL